MSALMEKLQTLLPKSLHVSKQKSRHENYHLHNKHNKIQVNTNTIIKYDF